MSDLFLVPIGDDWIDLFERTVRSGVTVESGDEPPVEFGTEGRVRVWGTTESSGHKKQSHMDAMAAEDLVMFLQAGEFIASARVDSVYHSADLGEWLWDASESSFVYTLTDYEEISVPRQDVWDVLGYSENYPLYGFSRVSDDARTSLLQTYNSVEEAFQAFRQYSESETETDTETGSDSESGGGLDTEPGFDSESPGEDATGAREHTEIQWHLVQLGLKHGYDVYVATNDQNLTYEGHRLGEDCVDNLDLPGFSDAAIRLIEYVDVIWLNGGHIEKMFEVESTTSIYSGILRMSDFVVKVPNLAVEMHIVAPAEDEDQVRRQMTRPTFQHVIDRAEHCSLQYLSFESVREKRELVDKAGPLQTIF